MCPFCGRSYKQLSSLKRHVKKVHVFNACPCCGRPLRGVAGALVHSSRFSDECHRMLAYLCSRGSRVKLVPPAAGAGVERRARSVVTTFKTCIFPGSGPLREALRKVLEMDADTVNKLSMEALRCKAPTIRSVKLPAELDEEVDERAKALGLTRSDLLRAAAVLAQLRSC
ncbi:ribbon-helix-helix protein, CopG family [Pyrolobus fumarii]|uniref:ribbon-helix-helix protein, CopG family n=1 Tax=Pyrolobus fumarii TaxID=54252 RepID=UPI001FCC502D|nr:ribbon-helix-helix protein, CopG family [Pyrolobus fumarii]